MKTANTSTEMLDWLKPESWWCLKLHFNANPSENCAWVDQASCSPIPHIAFKIPSLKVTGDSGSFEFEFHGLLACTCNKHCTFLHHHLVSVDWFYHVLVSKHKFGSVTVWPSSGGFFGCPCPHSSEWVTCLLPLNLQTLLNKASGALLPATRPAGPQVEHHHLNPGTLFPTESKPKPTMTSEIKIIHQTFWAIKKIKTRTIT